MSRASLWFCNGRGLLFCMPEMLFERYRQDTDEWMPFLYTPKIVNVTATNFVVDARFDCCSSFP
jgi:hypothetical protein